MLNMESKKILARTIKRLMQETPGLDSGPKVGKKARISQSSVGRMLHGSVAATLDTLDAIAKAFRKTPWELIRHEPADPGERPLLDNDDATLLEIYRSVNQDAQDEILALLKAYAIRHPPEKVKPVKRSTQGVNLQGSSSIGDNADEIIAKTVDPNEKEWKLGDNSADQAGGKNKRTK